MVSDMAASGASRTGVWAVHRDDVQGRIVDAFLDLVAAGAATSMPAVAEHAGISVRTLYRYFPSRDALQRYAAGWLDRRVLDAMEHRTVETSSMREYMRRLWLELTDSMLAVRVQHDTPEGRELRVARLAPARERVDAGLPPSITGGRRADVIDLIVAICSSSMFLELVDRMGHEPTHAADLVADLVELIIKTEGAP